MPLALSSISSARASSSPPSRPASALPSLSTSPASAGRGASSSLSSATCAATKLRTHAIDGEGGGAEQYERKRSVAAERAARISEMDGRAEFLRGGGAERTEWTRRESEKRAVRRMAVG
ncbi:hypothetical protein TeGR_g1645 [Tetraparma gracilis]|uniref:Uncharacterized protein n=1 Tax=Tetraparma gracilis TaxID=2962635 RepID=A0ABQ6MDH3_9STRA|nr:hypothetical protein TeGR_g1645 [Tetraparma gracilis]